MNALTKYTWIGYTAVRSSLAYVGEVVSRTIFMAVILFIFMRLWTTVYAGQVSNRLGGLTLQQMVWYLMITESLFLSSVRVSMEIDEEVRTGRLVVQLLRPLSYTFARLAQVAGERVVRLVLNMAAGSVVALALVGPIRFSAPALLAFVLLLPLTFVIDFFAYFAIGLGAFWFESTAGLTLIYARLMMVLGGTLLPFEAFPQRLQPIVRLLPFGSMAYAPARMFVGGAGEMFVQTILTQCGAAALFGSIVWWIQRSALKRIQNHGG